MSAFELPAIGFGRFEHWYYETCGKRVLATISAQKRVVMESRSPIQRTKRHSERQVVNPQAESYAERS